MDEPHELASALMAEAAALLEDASALAADGSSVRDLVVALEVEQAITGAGRIVAAALVILRRGCGNGS